MRCGQLVLLPLVLLTAATLYAGGPLVVGSSTSGADSQPFVWDNSQPIQYRTDGGNLGALNNSAANSMVAQMFLSWAQVPSASVSFNRAGSILGVADGNVNTLSELDSALSSCLSGSQTPIIYDDGNLLLQLFGDDSVLGVTGPCVLSPSGKIQSAFSLLGNPAWLPANFVAAVMLHEFGHLIGLDHTDVRVPYTTGTTQADIDATPTMFFLLITPLQSTLGVDDKAWISKLYPSSQYVSSYGTITGQVFFSDGKTPVQDVLIIARAVNDIHGTTVASISGYKFTGNPGQPYTKDYLPCTPATDCTNGTLGDNSAGSQFGSRDPSLIGNFELSVPPGQYTIELGEFSGGRIGPIDPPFLLPGPKEYWDTNESANDGDWTTTLDPAGVVTVSAGQTVSNINIILNGTDPTFDIFEH